MDVNIIPLFANTHDHSYTLPSGQILYYHSRYDKSTVHLKQETVDVSHKFFLDDIWPGSLLLSDYISSHSQIVHDKSCIELGAAYALPSMVASVCGAKKVISTDYPLDNVIENMESIFIKNNLSSTCQAFGYIWGTDVSHLYQQTRLDKYDVILIAEPLWKDTYNQHDNLVYSITQLLHPIGVVYISFAHRPTYSHTAEQDMEFFTKLKKYHMKVELVLSSTKYNDVGEIIPIEIYLYKVTWCESHS